MQDRHIRWQHMVVLIRRVVLLEPGDTDERIPLLVRSALFVASHCCWASSALLG